MSITPLTTKTGPVPAQRVATSARFSWPDPIPAARVWMGPASAMDALGGTIRAPAKLHRVERWKRGGDGLMYARCGAPAQLWFAAPDGSSLPRCLSCEDMDDVL